MSDADSPPSAAEPAVEAKAEKPQRAVESKGLLLALLVFALLTLFGTISLSGIWDPPELEVAELGRRIALNLLGAKDLLLAGGENEVPTRADLGRGELPFTSVALGFRLLGLHDWAGRLPLAVWGLLGVIAVFGLVSRLADRRAAVFCTAVLLTTPLYFLHARTMLGDIVTMSSLAISMAGFGIAIFDSQRAGEDVGRARLRQGLAAALGVAGLASGFFARGPLLGVAVPALSLGLGWLCLRLAGARRADRLGDAIAVAVSCAGLVFAVLGVRAVLMVSVGEFSLWLGSTLQGKRELPVFDAMIAQLGHAMFPWSAVVPLALGCMLRAPQAAPGEARERESALRLCVLLVVGIAFGVHAATTPYFGVVPFAGVSALAMSVGLALRDIERGAPVSRALALSVAAFAILLLVDFRNFPDKALSAFAVSDARLPDSFKHFSARVLGAGALAFAGIVSLALLERDDPGARRFELAEYRVWYSELKTLWSGNLLFAALVAEAALVGFLGLGQLSDRYLHLQQFETMGTPARTGAGIAAVVLPLALFAPSIVTALRDVMRALTSPGFGVRALRERSARLARFGVSRASVALLAGAGFGAVLSFGYYPVLAAQISPKKVFAAFKTFAKPGEELGLIGTGSGSASYYAGHPVPAFDNAQNGFEWLTGSSARRWLVIRAGDLANMNSLFRTKRRANLPVLDARSSEILLVSNELREGEINQNPFRDWLSHKAPAPKHPLDANLGSQLDVLGWDVFSPEGVAVDAVEPGRPYRFVIYYRVVAPISGSWETFIHIDGFQRRFNADHATLEGRYPFNLWRVGDYVSDSATFELEPNFTPGSYKVLFGLFSGTRRLEVKRGSHEENRLNAGSLVVR